ncbi:hypothetical protein IWW45_004582 [Coemansia sp. RSA 485]|nr:hypothetical protein IWW45_004582 [Coemansia sp. RSA 485]
MVSSCTGSQTQPSQGLSEIGRDSGSSVDQVSQLSREWMQSLISQVPMHQFTDMPQPINIVSSAPGITTISESTGSTTADPTMSGAAASSDSDSDDFSKSLSFLLSQHLSQQQMSTAKRAYSSNGMLPESGAATAASTFGTGFAHVFDMGYNDRQRIINMPNPLGSLSLDIPINPQPVQPMLGMDLVGAHQVTDKHLMYGVQPHAQAQHQQNMLITPMACTSARSLEPVNGFTAMHEAKTLDNAPTPTPTPILAPMGSSGSMVTNKTSADSNSRSALGISASKRSKLSTTTTFPAGPGARSVSMAGGLVSNSKPRRGRPPLANKRAASAGKALTPAEHSSGVFGIHLSDEAQQLSVPGTPGACIDVSLNGTMSPSMSSASALLPHRVDRQLAVEARPLLFVRPSTSKVQSRRRKRQGGTPSEVETPVTGEQQGADMAGDEGQGAVHWQRISEQRRRDAMRESFDLLKRMLPQKYMDSDDGRELARPVLLARFVRWVDDTLIEMEALKSEVFRLRLCCENNPCSNEPESSQPAASLDIAK